MQLTIGPVLSLLKYSQNKAVNAALGIGHLLMPLMELHSLITECELAVITAPLAD